MNRFLIGAALAATLVLAGCGDDEEEKQKARIAANAALLTAQQEQITSTVPQIAALTARLNDLQKELAGSEATIAEKNAAEARLAELQAESAELADALRRIDEFQARAKLVNPDAGDYIQTSAIGVKNGAKWTSARYIEPAYNLLMYVHDGSGRSAEISLDQISERAAPRLQQCLAGKRCVAPSATKIGPFNNTYRFVDWDAGLVVYANDSHGARFTIYPFEHFGEEFAARMHAEADALREYLASE